VRRLAFIQKLYLMLFVRGYQKKIPHSKGLVALLARKLNTLHSFPCLRMAAAGRLRSTLVEQFYNHVPEFSILKYLINIS